VTARPRSALTLIIDRDLGFLMWLGEVFTALGFQTIPALHCRQAQAMAQQLDLPIQILVIDPELRGAKRLVQRVAAANAGVRIVLIGNSAVQGNGSKGIQAWSRLQRPSPGESISRSDWLVKIRDILLTGSGK
jgi:hypothetical protein